MFKWIVLNLFLFVLKLSYSQCINTGISLTTSTVNTNINCSVNDGSITVNTINGFRNVSAPNGTGYTYAITAGPVIRATQSSNVFLSLPAGTYTVLITDCNALTNTINATIAGVYNTLSSSAVTLPSICFNNNGIKTNPGGGKAPYTITINAAPIGSNPIIKNDTIWGLTSGTISFRITDACGTIFNVTSTINSYSTIAVTRSDLFWSQCANSRLIFNNNLYGSVIDYRQNFTFNTNTYDTIFYDLYFGGVLVQTKAKNSGNTIYNATIFNNPGYGNYKVITRSKCAIINIDSFTLKMGAYDALPGKLKCSNFDISYRYSPYLQANDLKNGITYFMLSYPLTAKIIAGPSRVGYTKIQTNYAAFDTIADLSYGSYSIQLKDSCGNMDTVYITQNSPVASINPNINTCVGYCVLYKDAYRYLNLAASFPNTPKITPLKYTFLSGTNLDFIATFPFTIIDSSYINNGSFSDFPVKNNGMYTIAIENGCGSKDTIEVDLTTCLPNKHPTVSSVSFVPRCGNTADITIKMALGAGNCGSLGYPQLLTSIPPFVIGNSTTSNVYAPVLNNVFINQPAGAYKFYLSTNFGYNTSDGIKARYIILPTTNPAIGYSYVGPTMDTSKMRLWDTAFTFVLPTTSIQLSASSAYMCKDGVGTCALKISPNFTVQPVSYQYSTVSNSGPWSVSQLDSLIQVGSVALNNSIYILGTDGCGSTQVINSTVQQLSSLSTPLCNSNIAEFNPNPFNTNFSYNLRNLNTANLNRFNFPNMPNIDLSVPSNAGYYSIGYKFKSTNNVSCILDSTVFLLQSPCAIALNNTLLKLKATILNNKKVTVSWVASEQFITYKYEIQRSKDGFNFESIGYELAKKSIQNLNNYNFIDLNLNTNDIYFYRLKLINTDGSFTFSNIVSVNIVRNNQIEIYPNPAKDFIHINLPLHSKKADIVIANTLGNTVLEQSILENSVISIQNLSCGLYFLKLKTNTGFITFKFIKE